MASCKYIAALVLCAFSAGANAALIDVQPRLNRGTGNCTFATSCATGPDVYGAENFSLSSAATIKDISFYSVRNDNDHDPYQLLGVDWLMMEDSGRNPGSVIAGALNDDYAASYFGSGTAYPSNTGSIDHWKYDIDVENFVIGPGDYWLGFRLPRPDPRRGRR